MLEFKRVTLLVIGTILKVFSILLGIYILFIGAVLLFFDGFAGSTNNYPGGAGDTNFLLGAMPFVAVAVLAYWLGSYLRENNRNSD